MPKVTDMKAYFRDLASKAGLDDAKLKQVMEVMDDDKFAQAFQTGFKPLPDYSHDLDDVRSKTKNETEAAINAKVQAYYDQEKAKYEANQKVFEEAQARAKRYEDVYGALDNPNPDPLKPTPGGSMTKDEIKALLEAEMNTTLTRRDAAVIQLLEVRESHMNTFKKSLDTKAFEAAWKEHPEWGGDLRMAYNQFVEPEAAKIREADIETRIKAKYEEGLRDGYSRKGLPTDHQPKTFAAPGIFGSDVDVSKMDEKGQESHSRSAFFDELRKPANSPA